MDRTTQIHLLNKKSIMVAPENVERAKAIIADVVECSLADEPREPYSLGEKDCGNS